MVFIRSQKMIQKPVCVFTHRITVVIFIQNCNYKFKKNQVILIVIFTEIDISEINSNQQTFHKYLVIVVCSFEERFVKGLFLKKEYR